MTWLAFIAALAKALPVVLDLVSRFYVWNPSPRGRGWQEVAYRHHAMSFRVPG